MTPEREARLRSVIGARQLDLTVVMENVHDPHNVSAVLRSCDAVGIHQVHIVTPDPPKPRVGKKSSASARKWVVRRFHADISECLAGLKQEGFTIAATHLSENSVGLHQVDFTQKIALLFGNEHAGLTEEAMKHADINFMIPMVGMIPSLNISVACAVSLYEAFRQRAEKPDPAHGFSPEAAEALYEEWVVRDRNR